MSKQKMSDLWKLLAVFLFGAVLWFFCQPEALPEKGWHLFVVFVCTIIAIVAKPLPMGALSIIAVTLLITTHTVPLSTALEGFAYDQIWLIVMACFLSRGFIKTGLGNRLAYLFVSLFGGNPIGLGYGMVVSSLSLAPLIPSATARTGGIILPILKSLVSVIGHEPGVTGKGKKIAEYLTMIVFQASVVTSAIFITGNAASPIAAKFAQDLSIPISWGDWALGASVPGIVTLILLPPLLLFLLPCSVEDPQKIREHTKQELKSMGKTTRDEKILSWVFAALLILWSAGSFFHVQATTAAFLGVSALLITKVLNWKDLLGEEMAWDTFCWMAILVMMATELQRQGVISYFTKNAVFYIPASSWMVGLLTISLFYFLSHYFFASATAHVSSMYAPLLTLALAIGAPPLLSALFLGYISNLYGGITHYASGPAPILYAQNYIDVKKLWYVGAVTGVFYLVVWTLLGSVWWSWLGLF